MQLDKDSKPQVLEPSKAATAATAAAAVNDTATKTPPEPVLNLLKEIEKSQTNAAPQSKVPTPTGVKTEAKAAPSVAAPVSSSKEEPRRSTSPEVKSRIPSFRDAARPRQSASPDKPTVKEETSPKEQTSPKEVTPSKEVSPSKEGTPPKEGTPSKERTPLKEVSPPKEQTPPNEKSASNEKPPSHEKSPSPKVNYVNLF